MRIKFVRSYQHQEVPLYHPGPQHIWKRFYIPPWRLIYHIVELFCLLYFYIFISTPTIDFYYMNRQVFVDAFYPDYESSDEAISTIEEITDYFESMVDSLDAMIDDSFMRMYLTPRDEDILCELLYLNGTQTFGPVPDDLDHDFFYHLSHIIVSVDFYVFSESPKVKGCSRWQIQTEIYSKLGSSQFSIIPSIRRIQCNSSFIERKGKDNKLKEIETLNINESIKSQNKSEENNAKKSELSDEEKETERILNSMKVQSTTSPDQKEVNHLHKRRKPISFKSQMKRIRDRRHRRSKKRKPDYTKKQTYMSKRLNFNIKSNKKKLNEIDTHIDQESLELYRSTYRISIELFVISFVHIILMCYRMRKGFKVHLEFSKSNPEYRALSTLNQFHLTIGIWTLIDFISSIVVFSASIFVYIDTMNMTQFPSQAAIEFVSVAIFISLIRFNQWFGSYLPFYQLIVILREAFVQLFYLVFSIMPIVTGLSLFGIFFFGFVDDSYQTFRYLVQRMITSGMGDSIDDFFIVTDDGTDRTAWISFFYVGIITALGMWIVFTSCIATVSYVHQNHIVSRDSYWESSSESEAEEDSD